MADVSRHNRIATGTSLLAVADRERPVADLPVSLTSFVGREREIGAVRELLRTDGVRLVTLTGPGGVGKTRLALRVAAELADDFANGVAFVPLAAISDPSLVAPAIAQILGVRPAGDRPVGERLIAALRGRRLLLVLDNFEQNLAAAPLITDLLTACPGLATLVTSRATLNVSSEHAVPVPPLTLSDPVDGSVIGGEAESEAVRLFVTRARAAKHGFALTGGNAAAVAAICRRLDGLPLAIELAAARSNILSPAALLARLDRRLAMLTGGPHDAPPRLRSMGDAIGWSHDLLTPEEQALFRRLSVFVGGFTLEAAEAVTQGLRESDEERATGAAVRPSIVLDLIDSLVERSLLRPDEGPVGEPRFGMLDTVREYGLEQLTAHGEADATRRRHAAWCLALAEQAAGGMWSADEPAWLDRIDTDLANLRAALTWFEQTGNAECLQRLGYGL